MGYDIYITRKENWFDKLGSEITLSEWIAFVGSDPEMRLDGYAEAEVGQGKMLRVESAGLAVWIAYSKHGKDGNMAWFDFRRGSVVAKNPSPEIIAKMSSIARVLLAKVQGDECELYGIDGNVIAQR
ncbi:hypothetical protein [Collimonas arenae]|uniref:hypothetical protein n=1 Tax=Collimonas arenae TaxID=279058 RepID=UPI00056ECC3E|nr:hypothetical protein [Collimonas arenae]